MELLTDDLKATIPKLYETEHKSPSLVEVKCKFFNPCGSGTWYVTEFDGEDLFFGWANLGDDTNAELGYFSISELESIKFKSGLTIERDLHWNPTTKLKDVMNFKIR